MQYLFGKDFEDSNPIFRQILYTLAGDIPVALGYLWDQGLGIAQGGSPCSNGVDLRNLTGERGT